MQYNDKMELSPRHAVKLTQKEQKISFPVRAEHLKEIFTT